MNLALPIRRRTQPKAALALLLSLSLVPSALAQTSYFKGRAKPNQIQKSLDDYISRVRARAIEEQRTMGSIWTPSAPLGITESDYKARLPGDLLIIKVSDSFSSTNAGQAQQQRTFSASSSATSSLITNTTATSRLSNLFSPTSAENLGGKGQSTLNSTLSISLAARVVDTLPNGVMIVEAVRDFNVGNDRQTIVVHGLVRPGDVAPDNSVPSSAVANLEAEVHGRGVVADAIRQPNIVVRTLLKILNF